MNYVIVYEPQVSRRLELHKLAEDGYEAARDLRFSLEMKYRNERRDVEVVLLQADDDEALVHTHARYFEDLAELMERRATRQRIPA